MKKRIIGAIAATAAATFAVAPSVEASPPAPEPSIVDIAVAVNAESGEFSTLLAAVGCADAAVAETLSTRGQHTVFAPTDAAFAAIGVDADTVCILGPAVVTEVLLYHVANGSRDAADVTTSDQIRMLNREFTMVDGATIDGANIIATDFFATNGVIHVIDGVLLPDLLTG
jgi:uncharacterized surface protein with fasciclin (FAS1) repeats